MPLRIPQLLGNEQLRSAVPWSGYKLLGGGIHVYVDSMYVCMYVCMCVCICLDGTIGVDTNYLEEVFMCM